MAGTAPWVRASLLSYNGIRYAGFHHFWCSCVSFFVGFFFAYRYEALESDEEKGSDNDSDVSNRPDITDCLMVGVSALHAYVFIRITYTTPSGLHTQYHWKASTVLCGTSSSYML